MCWRFCVSPYNVSCVCSWLAWRCLSHTLMKTAGRTQCSVRCAAVLLFAGYKVYLHADNIQPVLLACAPPEPLAFHPSIHTVHTGPSQSLCTVCSSLFIDTTPLAEDPCLFACSPYTLREPNTVPFLCDSVTVSVCVCALPGGRQILVWIA